MRWNRQAIAGIFIAVALLLTGCSSEPTVPASASAQQEVLPAAPDASALRPTRPVTTKVMLADNDIAVDGFGAAVQGSTLTITADGVYEIKGTLDSGEIIVDAPDNAKVELVLSGVSITGKTNAAIYCTNADDFIITLAEGTLNTLTDAKSYVYTDLEKEEPNAVLFSKCDLNIGGKGYLTVNANFKHGISTKDDLEIEGGGFVVKAVGDGIRGKDSVTVMDGSFNLDTQGDGIQSNGSSDDPAQGWALIKGGSYIIRSCGDAIQAETDLTIEAGDFDIVTDGRPSGDSDSQKGLKAANVLTVNGGDFSIISKDDAIHCDTDTVINGGTFYIETDDDGIHADRNLYINGGAINIPDCYEGFEGTIIEVNGGKSFIDASNDAVSAAAGTPEAEAFSGRGGNPSVQAWFNGGELEAVSGGDTVDSNGHIYVTGGMLRLSSPPRPDYEGSLLCNGDVYFSGGSIAAVGCMGVNVYWEEQPILWISHADELPKGTVLSLRDEAGNTLLEHTTRSGAVQSSYTSPELKAGSTYGLYIDGMKKLDVTLESGMNVIGDNGGKFTGGYSRGNIAELRKQ